MTQRNLLLKLSAGAAMTVGVRAWASRRLRYRLDGFPSARVPSIRLHLSERLGIRDFYSQIGQDKWVLGVVFPGVQDGYFLEIGAADSHDGSNSLALEKAGWSGICIEPFPTGDWSDRKALLIKEAVYSTADEEVDFTVAGTRGGISDHLGRWEQATATAPIVRTTTMLVGDLLDQAEAPAFIHYLSLDTEGSEYEILRTMPFDQYQFGAITIEHNGEAKKRREIRGLLESHGYRFDREHVVEDWYLSAGLHRRSTSNRIRQRRQA